MVLAYKMERVEPSQLASVWLRRAADESARRVQDAEAYVLHVAGELGVIDLLYLPVARRVGVAWGTVTQWIECESLDRAVSRLLLRQLGRADEAEA